ncbi:MAG TPA: hypothetical protein VHI95_03165 [Acidimicrobiales bacterium]|jgi:hypothetical protein|nr:hypothetical protein [Acidimicrobiales bacterium]
MPVAQSDPRRATIIGIVGVVVGVVMIVVVLLANNLGGDRSTTQSSRSRFHVGPPEATAQEITERGPLFFNDTATGSRPLVVSHVGDDPATGWHAFDAATGSCVISLNSDTKALTDCDGHPVSPDGAGKHQYPVTVTKDEVIVDLSADATTTTTTTTIPPPSTSN